MWCRMKRLVGQGTRGKLELLWAVFDAQSATIHTASLVQLGPDKRRIQHGYFTPQCKYRRASLAVLHSVKLSCGGVSTQPQHGRGKLPAYC